MTTTETFYCIYNGHKLDPAVNYCTDCMGMDCAVTADELIDFKLQETYYCKHTLQQIHVPDEYCRTCGGGGVDCAITLKQLNSLTVGA
jgi:hypothetical protein